MTLSTYAASWLEYAKLDRAAGTVKRYKATLDNLCADLGEMEFAEIRADMLKAWQLARAGEVAASTLAVDVTVVQALFSTAHKEGVLETNPAATLRRPPVEPHEREIGLTWVQAKRTIEVWGADPEKSALLLLLSTGMRIGELTHLRWKDIKDGTACIRAHEGWRPKSRCSARRIPLGPLGQKALEKLAELRGESDNPPVVDINKGARATENQLRRALRDLCKDAEIPKLTPHALRHLFATRLAEKNVHPEVGRRILGHASMAIFQRYLHPDMTAMKNAVRGL